MTESHPAPNDAGADAASAAGKAAVLRGESAQLLLDSIIPYQLNRLSYRMNRLLDRELRTHGMSMSIWRIMAVLDYNASASVNELAQYAMIEQSTISRILQRMEASGLLEIKVAEGDARSRAISLTDLGRTRYETVRSVTMQHTGRIVKGFTREERSLLMAFISRMQVNVETLGVDPDVPENLAVEPR